jgi:leader peptidase (prepilin peptidase)/N-methyltransferase
MPDTEYFDAIPFHFWTVTFFIFGCIVGSFLNVCIYRLPRGENIIFPPSHCPHCNYHIPWYLNIPLFTWVFLRGRCAHCRAPITVRYFIVELLTGSLFALSWLCVGNSSLTLALIYCLVIGALIVSSFIDLEHFLIPDSITLGGIGVGFVLSFFFPQIHWTDSLKLSMQESFLGILVGGGILYAISRLGKLAFGRYRYKIKADEKIILSEEALETPSEKIPYSEIFYRPSDRIIIQAASVELTLVNAPQPQEPAVTEATEPTSPASPSYQWESARIELSPTQLKVDSQTWDPSEVRKVELNAHKLTLPREVMGLGDVKFMAAIGAFFGWKAVIFILFASSLLGSLVGLTLVALRKHELSARIPYGPYLALGALLWMMGGYYWYPSLFELVNRILSPFFQS